MNEFMNETIIKEYFSLAAYPASLRMVMCTDRLLEDKRIEGQTMLRRPSFSTSQIGDPARRYENPSRVSECSIYAAERSHLTSLKQC